MAINAYISENKPITASVSEITPEEAEANDFNLPITLGT